MQPHTPTPANIQPSRREFLKKAGILTGGILALGLPLPLRQASSALAAAPPSDSVRYALDLGGQIAGPIISLDSGFTSGQVVEGRLGQSLSSKKHLDTIVPEDVFLECRNNMTKDFYLWIQQALGEQAPKRSGGILTMSMGNQLLDRQMFTDAFITEVTFPALDRTSTTQASIGLKLKPRQWSYQSGGSQIAFPTGVNLGGWLSSHFRVGISGLESACAHIVKVDSLVWKQSLSMAQDRLSFTSGPIQTPNLVVTLPRTQAGPFTEWFKQFVINGKSSDSDERSGSLEFLAPDQQTVLFKLNFEHLGIFRMSPIPPSPTNATPLVKVEMYCETLRLTEFPSPGPAQTPLTPAMVLGVYRHNPVQNAWHEGSITQEGATLRWTNKAGATWRLVPDLANQRLLAEGPDNPYAQYGSKEFKLIMENGFIKGFAFGGGTYLKQ